MFCLKELLISQAVAELKEEAFLSLTDLLLFFNKEETSRTVLAPLVYK